MANYINAESADYVQRLGFRKCRACWWGSHQRPLLASANHSSLCCAELAGLVGCVAIANRKTDGCTLSLQDFDTLERGIFRTMITRASSHCPSMPDEFKAQLADHMTIQQLNLKLDQMYRNFIVQHWKPRALERMEPKVFDTQAQLTELGPNVGSLAIPDVLQHLTEQVRAAFLLFVQNAADVSVGQHMPAKVQMALLKWHKHAS